MITLTLTEVIFTGNFSIVDMIFLKELLNNARESRFHFPEDISFNDYNQVISIFESNDYVDFVIITDNLNINGQMLKNVFINLGLNEGKLELLYFFDLKDLKGVDYKMIIDNLRIWTEKFNNQYGFKDFVCQIDNGNENEYYFNNKGIGPLYKDLIVT